MNGHTVAMNVVLTGFMGTGKTTVGQILATRLDLTFVDTDVVIESRHGPIPEIFANEGEAAFRSMERNIAAEIGADEGLVVATGGRLMLDQDARTSLEASGRVFCLAADVDELISRLVAAAQERPLLDVDDPAQAIRGLLTERAAQYAAFEQVDTFGRSPEAIADDIVTRLAE